MLSKNIANKLKAAQRKRKIDFGCFKCSRKIDIDIGIRIISYK